MKYNFICWSLATKPSTANSKTIDENGIGTFTSAISGLESNTTYYVGPMLQIALVQHMDQK